MKTIIIRVRCAINNRYSLSGLILLIVTAGSFVLTHYYPLSPETYVTFAVSFIQITLVGITAVILTISRAGGTTYYAYKRTRDAIVRHPQILKPSHYKRFFTNFDGYCVEIGSAMAYKDAVRRGTRSQEGE